MNLNAYPKWQTPLRAAQQALGRSHWGEESPEEKREMSNGRRLHFILETVFGIPTGAPGLTHNYYQTGGFWFAIKTDTDQVIADDLPVYTSTSITAGHKENRSKATFTFTLYVGCVTPDDVYPDWPKVRALVARDLPLQYGNYSRVQADLAALLDALDDAYQAELPRFVAWRDAQQIAPDQQAFFMELIRRALKDMPARERLPEPPVQQLALTGFEPAPEPTMQKAETAPTVPALHSL